MKRFFIILVLCFSSLSYSQKQQIGLKAGVNFAHLNAKEADYKSRISFHAGLLMENFLSDKLSFVPELVFSSQGAKQFYESTNYEFRLNYVNLPLLLRFYPNERLYFEAGPQVGILVGSRQSSDSGKDTDIVNIKGQDYGFNFGVGYKANSVVGFSVRYYLGLRDINDHEFHEKLKNGVLQASLNFYLK